LEPQAVATWFRGATGLRPAQFVRLARFERFATALQAEPMASLAELAYVAGYADQAHLTHDVRRLSQMTPGELRARLIPAGGGVRD
jgi:AraC-like DNA-binding protein